MLTEKERKELDKWKSKKRPQTANQIAWDRMLRKLKELGVEDMTPKDESNAN